MYLTININTEMFADYVFLFILLGLVEKDNEDFLLNKSEAWNKLIDLIDQKNMKVSLMQKFFRIKSSRRSKFNKLQKIMYSDSEGKVNLNIINDKNIFVSEAIDKTSDTSIDNIVKETLKLVIPNNVSFTDKDLKEITKKVKKKLNKK